MLDDESVSGCDAKPALDGVPRGSGYGTAYVLMGLCASLSSAEGLDQEAVFAWNNGSRDAPAMRAGGCVGVE